MKGMRKLIILRFLLGTIELEAHVVNILGKVRAKLPFEITSSKEIREDLRLKYRYLDLRNKKVRG